MNAIAFSNPLHPMIFILIPEPAQQTAHLTTSPATETPEREPRAPKITTLTDISQITPKFREIVPPFHRQGNCIPWRLVLEPAVVRYRDTKLKRYFRADTAVASPDVYDVLEAEEFLYAIRLLDDEE
ncbi:MAG: hypothetical protein O7I42_21310, partial [Alphaproteobacteria bacterium]|nr:hypothetical protein [Alphaproteobacteria bacterium]